MENKNRPKDYNRSLLHFIKPKFRERFPKGKFSVERHEDKVIVIIHAKPSEFFDEKD